MASKRSEELVMGDSMPERPGGIKQRRRSTARSSRPAPTPASSPTTAAMLPSPHKPLFERAVVLLATSKQLGHRLLVRDRTRSADRNPLPMALQHSVRFRGVQFLGGGETL
jgi:hypothetical protein